MQREAKADTLGKRKADGPFTSLQHRDFRLLYIGQFISDAGSQMQMVAMNWQIYIITKSAFALGLMGFVRFTPVVIFSVVGGMLADVHDRRRILLVTQSSMTLLAALLGFLSYGGAISVITIYALAALTSAANSFDSPARQSLIPNLVPLEHLTNALSLNSIMHKTATIAGPGLAGFVIAWGGVAAVYWLNAASFLAVLIALLLMRIPTRKSIGATRMARSSLVEGIRFVRNSQLLWSTTLLDFAATFFANASSLLPIFAHEILHVGPQGLGILYASRSIGSVLTGAGMSLVRSVKRQGTLVLWAITLYGAATVSFGLSHWFSLSVIFLALVGAADTFSTILRNTIRQLVTPDQLRGRMNGLNMVFARGGQQLGNLEAGIVAAWIGTPLSVISGGLVTLAVVAAVFLWAPQLRKYQEEFK